MVVTSKSQKKPAKGHSNGPKGGVVKLKESTATIPKGTIVMVVDEFGDLGVVSEDPDKSGGSKHFGYAVSITDDPIKFAELTDDRRKTNGKELKAYKDTYKGKRAVAKGVSDMNVDVRVHYVDKTNPPQGWSGKKGSSKDMDKLFHQSVNDSLPKKGNVLVVVDRHSGHRNVESFLKEQSKADLNVRGGMYDSYSGPYSELLQTQDYVAYAARDALDYNNRRFSDLIGMKFFRKTRL